jgi:excisionase family DNA binding protein
MKDIRLLTVDQVAHLCQVSIRTVYRAIARGSLRASHLGRGGAYRIRPEDVEAWVDGTAVGASRRDAEARPPGTLVVPENPHPNL